jgi:hypothetical protein
VTETLTSRIGRRIRKWTGKPPALQSGEGDSLLDYVVESPSSQTAVDLLPGWGGAFPPESGITAGNAPFSADPRIAWAVAQSGGLEGKRVLELAAGEGWRTVLLDQENPASLDALEADRLAFLRGLVVKEVMRLSHAKMHLGDSRKWLDERSDRYDLIVAADALDRTDDGAGLLRAIAARTDALILWSRAGDAAAKRQDILDLLTSLGFADRRLSGDDPNAAGPDFTIFARRRAEKPADPA